jgi:hypothetical protein
MNAAALKLWNVCDDVLSIAGTSDLFLPLRFTAPEWQTFAEFVD